MLPRSTPAIAEVTTESLPFPGSSRDALSEILKQGAQRMLACAIEAEVGEWIDGRTDETVYIAGSKQRAAVRKS